MGNCIGTSVHIEHSPCSTGPPSPSSARIKGQITTIPSGLKMFTLAELRVATRNFTPATVLGEGGFGRVFKGWVDKSTHAPSMPGFGMTVAVKRSNPDSLQGLKEWQTEIEFLGKFSHPNLVKLFGYCCEDNQFLLVYEYMKKGSLDKHLFKKGAKPLSWKRRINIAIGAAKGLAFLHTSEKNVIYRDFKASNILIDENYNAKLSDFGLAKLGPINGDSHVSTQPMGTLGYAAPEYITTGHLYLKSDVYGFGVVLLEILTGMKALDMTRPKGQQNLVQFIVPSLYERKTLIKIMDPKLKGKYPSEGAIQVAKLVLKCLENDPEKRPSMEEVVETLHRISDGGDTKGEVSSNEEIEQTALPFYSSVPRNSRNRHRSPLHPRSGCGGYGTRGCIFSIDHGCH